MLPGKGKVLPVYGPFLHNPAQMRYPIQARPMKPLRESAGFFDRLNERLRSFYEGQPARISDTGRVRAPLQKYGPHETDTMARITRRRNGKAILLLVVLYCLDRLWENWRDYCDAIFHHLSNDEIQRHRAPFLSFLFARLPGYQEKKNMYEVIERIDRMNAKSFIRSVKCCPYGVLGSQLSDGSKSMLIIAETPDDKTMVVDPVPITALENESELPGSAKALRTWLTRLLENTDNASPIDFSFGSVNKSVIGDCYAKKYAHCSVVHCVVPDFRYGTWTKSSAISTLASCYANILKEFASPDCPCDRLRLPILSSGRLAGTKIIDELPNITIEAMIRAFTLLKTLEQETLLMRIKHNGDGGDTSDSHNIPQPDKRVDLCVFVEREWSLYDNSRDVLAERIY